MWPATRSPAVAGHAAPSCRGRRTFGLPAHRVRDGGPLGFDLSTQHVRAGDKVFLKLDVQGYERLVLAGAKASLPRVHGLQLEMSLVPLYQGEASYTDLLGEMTALGFQLMSIEAAFRDPRSGQLLAMDGVFFRP